jgi:hypothetical protein
MPKVLKLPEQRVTEQDEQFIAQLADHGVPATAFARREVRAGCAGGGDAGGGVFECHT